MKPFNYLILIPIVLNASPMHGLTIGEFLLLKPLEKVDRFAQLSPQDKAELTKKNIDRLSGKASSTGIKECIGCYFENATIEGDYSGAVLTGAIFKNCIIKNSNLSNAIMGGTLILGGEISNCDLSGIMGNDCTMAGLKPSAKPLTIINTNLSKAKLNRANMHADCVKVNLDELDGVNLKLRLSKFDSQCSLKKANLQLMDAFFVEFNQTDLTESDMRNATLVEMSFFASRLTKAFLNDALVIYTQFADVQADGMHLEGTNFAYAVNFTGANLAKSSISAQTNWKGAHFCQTIMPSLKAQQAVNLNQFNEGSPEKWAPLSSLIAIDQQWWRAQAQQNSSIIQNKDLPLINNDDCGKPSITHSWEKDSLDVDSNKGRLALTNQCTQCFLEDADLRGKNLTGAQLQGAWMVNANLQGTNLSGANLKGTRLSGAITDAATKFQGAYLCNTLMPESLYNPGDNWRNDNCNNPAPAVAQMPPSEKESPQSVNLKKLLDTKSCPQCDLSYVTIKDTKDLSNLNAPGANFMGAKFNNTTMNFAKFPKARFEQAVLTNVVASQADFSQANCFSFTIDGPRSDFSRVNFNKANLEEATFKEGTNLQYAKFEEANFYLTSFKHCNMKGASLKNSPCNKCKFIGTDLTNANLIGTGFLEADLTDADLTGAATDSSTNFNLAIFCRTKMPDGKVRNDNCPPH